MATDPDRQSDGHAARPRRRALSELPGGIHGAFQFAWALAMAVPTAARVSELVSRPSGQAALAIIEVTAIWALLAAAGWLARLVMLSSCGRLGARTRQRFKETGRRRRAR